MTNVVVVFVLLFVLLFIQFRSINALSTTPPNTTNVMLESMYIHTKKKGEWIEVCERITARSSSPLLWWEKKGKRRWEWTVSYCWYVMFSIELCALRKSKWSWTQRITEWMNECWPSFSFISMRERERVSTQSFINEKFIYKRISKRKCTI